MKPFWKKISNTIDFLIKHVKITRKDIYFGIAIIVTAYFLNNLVLAANGYLIIELPTNKEAFYIKDYKGKTYFLFFNRTDFNKELDFVIKDKDKVVSTGKCVFPNGYYDNKLGLQLKDDEVKCLIAKDELVKKFEKKLLKEFKDYELDE